MPELFIEFLSEEIPARMQARAEEDLERLLTVKLTDAGLHWIKLQTFSAARRLGVVIHDLPAKAADVNEEKKGPRVGAPEQALQGFLKSAGLSSIDQAQIVEDKKGAFYVARIERAGRGVPEILAEAIPAIVRAFPWPKSMRSGSSDLTWVRPLHNICCLFDGKPVTIAVEGVGNEAATWGHRFHAPAKIAVSSFADYAEKLRAAKVIAFREPRLRLIENTARDLCAKAGLELVEDRGLLEEVAGLAEWPVVLMGDMDPAFLDLPGEVIRLSMRTHQKYFAVRDPKTKKLAPHFITVANIDAKDGGKAIAAGNRRVLSARLNDARFFWETDKKTPLFTEERKAKLQKIVFHQKLGSVWDKVERVKALAVELCAVTGADPKLVERAALLSKMDLVTETVGEFPELQGQIGRELSLAEQNTSSPPLRGRGQGEGGRSNAPAPDRLNAPRLPTSSPQGGGGEESVAIAIEDHYRPLGPNDRVPTDKVAVTLALADKLDTLTAFWEINEKPTGSSDPYALRRAGLGFNRIELAVGLHLIVRQVVEEHAQRRFGVPFLRANELGIDIAGFLIDRLTVVLRDQGKRHDAVDAVFDHGNVYAVSHLNLMRRVEALDAFLRTEDGANLLAGYKRAANILAAEEKKGKGLSDADVKAGLQASLLSEPQEKALYDALEKALPAARAAVEKEDFAAAMKALSSLRAPVDAFFVHVLVNAPEEQLRRNRLLLLARLVEATSAVADFSKIEG